MSEETTGLKLLVEELLEAGELEQLRSVLDRTHPADIAETIDELDEVAQGVMFSLLLPEKAALVLEELDYETQSSILRRLGTERAALILAEMSRDDIADLLGDLSEEEAAEILELMQQEEAEDVQSLLEYPDDTAGGLMTTEYIALAEAQSAAAAIDTLRALAPDAETAYYLYVIDSDRRLVGVVSLRDLITAPPDRLIKDIMNTNVISVRADMDQEDVARVVSKYDLLAVPVVDGENRLLGIVTVDDVIDVLEEETTEDIYRIGGNVAPAEVEEETGWLVRARSRLPWLVLLLFGELLAVRVISGFDRVIQDIPFLAALIPVMAGEAGNAATQSLAVVVRGIATGEVDPKRTLGVVARESKIGLTVGLVAGAVLAVTVGLWRQDPLLGAVVGAGLWVTMAVATSLGAVVPIIIHRFRFDPAVASGPFITTATDVVSMLIYFSLAVFLISRIGA